MNFFKDQDPLHTIKTEFNLQPDGDLNNLLQSSQFLAGSNQLQEMSKSGNRTAQNMSRKRRINHQGNGGGYLSEAIDGPSIAERKHQRSNTQGRHGPGNSTNNKTLNNTTTYGAISQHQKHGGGVLGGEDKARGGSLSYANHKYNQSASGIKRGSTAPGGQNNALNRGDLSLSYAKGGGPLDTSMTIQGGARHQYNVSSDLTANQ